MEIYTRDKKMNNRIKIIGVAMAAGIGFSTQAVASNFSYTYLEISANASIFKDEIRLPTNFGYEAYDGISGASLAGSYQFSDVLYVLLSSSYLENSGDSTELNATQSLIGLGSAFAVGSDTDINVGMGAASVDAKVCYSRFCINEDDTGLGLRAGIRHKVNDAFEISSVIGHDRFSDFGEITSISASASWWFNDSSSLSFGGGMDDDSDKSVSLGYRYTFGGR
jgi:hypothetical protein